MNFNRRSWRLVNLFLVLLILLSLRIVYWQIARGSEFRVSGADPITQVGAQPEDAPGVDEDDAEDTRELPLPLLQRLQTRLDNITRGSIYDRQGNLLAYDAPEGQRVYTNPSLAPLIGYTSGVRVGVVGLESGYNEVLLGRTRLDAQLEEALRQPIIGSDLVLTIDSEVQAVAAQALGERAGGVIVMDAHTGAVLALASYPHFDPNRVLEEGYIAGLEGCGGAIHCRAPFLNRVTQALYTPGSTWKTVTLIAGLETDQVSPETVFDFGEPVNGPNGSYYVYRVGGGVIPDPNHKENRLDLPMAYAKSANAAFAQIGAEMDPDQFLEISRRLGFYRLGEQPYPLEVEYSSSQVADPPREVLTNDLLRAATSIGQGELLVTPMQMAMVAAAVANDGDMPVPHFVEYLRAPYGLLSPGPLRNETIPNVMSEETAAQAHAMMITVVEEGGGGLAAVEGLTVGGKTGTAQLGGELNPHAWFIGFAEQGEQALAIAVVVEEAGGGWNIAAPIFSQVAAAAMQALNEEIEFQAQPLPGQ